MKKMELKIQLIHKEEKQVKCKSREKTGQIKSIKYYSRNEFTHISELNK